jgi:hypothetical protein
MTSRLLCIAVARYDSHFPNNSLRKDKRNTCENNDSVGDIPSMRDDSRSLEKVPMPWFMPWHKVNKTSHALGFTHS